MLECSQAKLLFLSNMTFTLKFVVQLITFTGIYLNMNYFRFQLTKANDLHEITPTISVPDWALDEMD